MKGKNLQPRVLYPARISFRLGREIKTFTDKQKLREFSTTKPALQQILKELLWQETQEKEKTYKNKTKSTKKVVIGTYILINTLNVNGLNAPTKRYRLAEWIKKIPVHMLSTRDPLQTKGHKETESEGTEKDIPCKWKSKESWSSNTHIRQNSL